MYTQCPHCQTIFGVSETHLSAAFGRVRCGHCRGQFNAKRHLLDELPEQPKQAETAPSPSGVEQQPNVTEPIEPGIEEIETKLSGIIPTDEIEYIDLSNPATQPEREEQGDTASEEIEASTDTPDIANDYIELSTLVEEPGQAEPAETISETTDASIEPPEISAAPPQLENRPEKEELDAIFATLDNRLEELSENADDAVIKPFEEFETNKTASEDYQDAFGNPDSQTEEDIKTSIETIFAAAEAELDKTDTAGSSENNTEHELPLDIFLTESDVELPASDEVEPPVEGVFITTTGDEVENIDLAADDDELDLAEDDSDEPISEQAPIQVEAPSFEQEELPFVLHNDLTTEQITPRSWQKTLGLSSLILILLLATGFQLALFRNVELANRLPVLKPYLLSFCQHLPCQFSGQRDIKRIQLTSRDVRSHPKGKNTILINAIFVNNARFDQPYPDILITLSDLTTTVIAQRRFSPQDYLAQAANTFQLMKSGKPVHISLEVLDPGNDAVNFQFEFL